MKIKEKWLFYKIKVFSLVFLFSGGLFLQALEITSSQTSYSIIITQLDGNNLSSENQTLVNSIPRLLKEEISGLTIHNLNPEEILAIRKEAVNKKLLEIYQDLRDKKKTRDQQPYMASDSNKINYQNQINSLLEEIKLVKAYDLKKIAVKDSLPIVFLSPKLKNEALFPAPEFSPLTFTQENKGDLLLTGSIEEIFGYFYLEIRIFDRLRSRIIFEYNNSGEASDLLTELSEMKKSIIPLILGREYGLLRIVPGDPKAFVFLNGSFAGIGNTEVPFAEPGDYTIEVAQKGFETKKLTLALKSGDEVELPVDLVPLDLGRVSLDSFPSAAMVYENSQYIGETPLEIGKQEVANHILLKKEGYQDKSFHIDKNSPETLNIPLLSQGESPSEFQQKKRSDFYFAFGFFLLSLPVPFFLEAYGNDYYNYYQANSSFLSEEERDRFVYTIYGVNISYSASWAVVAGLLANTLWQLYLYIDATNKLVD